MGNSHTSLLVATTITTIAAGLTPGAHGYPGPIACGSQRVSYYTVDWESEAAFKTGGPGKFHPCFCPRVGHLSSRD